MKKDKFDNQEGLISDQNHFDSRENGLFPFWLMATINATSFVQESSFPECWLHQTH
jgi:hypothetical protein